MKRRIATEARRQGGGPALPRWKRALFGAITVGLFFALSEGVLALLHVRPVVDTEDPYVGFASYLPLFVEQRQPDGSLLMVTAKNKLGTFNLQAFPKKKGRGAYRIFCLGGSTTYGHPYDDRTSFSGWLREILRRAAPTGTWEVVNAGGVSYASYRVARLMEELVQYAPDLFIVYSGQNEFLERRTYQGLIDANPGVTWLGAQASRTRVCSALRAVFGAVRPDRIQQARKSYQLTGEVDALLDVMGGLDLYTRDDSLADKITRHYAYNLHRMVRIAESADARILFVVPASNLKDCSPFKSQHAPGLGPAKSQRCDALIAQARAAREAGDPAAALPALRQAVAIDPRFAEAQYRLGQVELALGREAEAAASFERALDEDVCTLRQPTALCAALREAAKQEHVPLVDFPAMLQDSTFARLRHRILGQEYFLDHVHPTIAGNRMLAVALVERMIADGSVQPAPGWQEDAVGAAARAVESSIDARAQALALRTVARVFNWAGKTEEVGRLALQARALDPQDVEGLVVLGLQASAEGRIEDAILCYRQALAADPSQLEARKNLAVELSRAGRPDEALREHLQVLEQLPDDWHVHCNAAYTYQQLGRNAEALEHFARMVALKPGDPVALNTLAAAYAQSGRLDDAVRTADAAVLAARAAGQESMARQIQAMATQYAAARPGRGTAR